VSAGERSCRMPSPLAGVLVACLQAGACVTKPSVTDNKATSCGSSNLAGGVAVDPRLAVVNEGGVTPSVGRSEKLTACFYRDLERPSERQAITWFSLDTSIPTVAPSMGPDTMVTAVRFGKTKIRAS
jgi:hypothetical protein